MEQPRHRTAEDRRHDGEQQGGHQDPSRPAVGEAGESGEHLKVLLHVVELDTDKIR